MKTLRLSMILAACCVTGTLWAAEPPPAKPATPAAKPATPAAKPATGESATPKADEQTKDQQGTKDEEQTAADEKKAAARPKASGKGSSPERFVPSEQVRADFDVSFPIDI